MEGWKSGRVGDWEIGKSVSWKSGRLVVRKRGMRSPEKYEISWLHPFLISSEVLIRSLLWLQ
jgi:hypothetical protein